jgi:hypothetical protein
MIKLGTIKITQRDANDRKFIVTYIDNGEREIYVGPAVASLLWAAIEQGKKEVRDEIKNVLQIMK